MKDIIVLMFIVLGSIFILIAAIGVLRFKDVFSSMHATTKASSFGLLLIVTGVVLHFLTWVVVIKAVLVMAFIYLTAPLAAQAVSQAIKRTDKE
jgi:multicomponent Na+:H+ antiporter subunit G